VSISPIFLLYTQESIALTFFVTAGTFGAMSLFGYFTKKDLSPWGRYLMMGLFGIIIASVVNLFMQSSRLEWITTYVGVVVFVLLTAYDTQKIKNLLVERDELNEGSLKLALLGSFMLYLDFINLFLKLLRLFGKRK
jgi:FtsH-binding integral membrane protein